MENDKERLENFQALAIEVVAKLLYDAEKDQEVFDHVMAYDGSLEIDEFEDLSGYVQGEYQLEARKLLKL